MKWKVMTYNIQHGLDYRSGDHIDLLQIADVIREQNPDVVVLNEVRGAGEAEDYTDQTAAIAEALGWHSYFAKAFDVPDCGPYGNAVLSPHPFQAYTRLIPKPDAGDMPRFEPRCVLRAEFETEGGRFAVFGTHFGLSIPEEENAVATVRGMTDLEEAPFVFMGDLNAEPDDPVLEPLYDRMQDTAAVFSAPQLSHPSDKPTVKIDYIFASENVRVLSAEILPVTASDHRPYIAEIEF